MAAAVEALRDSSTRLLTPARRRAVAHGLIVAGWLFFAWLFVGTNVGVDAYAYWTVDFDNLYAGTHGERGFFPYSPAIALVVSPVGLLPWPLYIAGWIVFLIAALAWLTGRAALVFLALPPVASDIVAGNITLLLAVAVVIGFRWPVAWSVVLLTKVTPGIGLLWFAVRREWRNLAIALGATGLIAAATWLLLPAQWLAWIELLFAGAPASVIPLWPRIPIAAAMVVWGALTDRRWTVIAAATLATPRMGFTELSLLVGIYGLHRHAGLLNSPRPAPLPAPSSV